MRKQLKQLQSQVEQLAARLDSGTPAAGDAPSGDSDDGPAGRSAA
jgi:hypothetical protein